MCHPDSASLQPNLSFLHTAQLATAGRTTIEHNPSSHISSPPVYRLSLGPPAYCSTDKVDRLTTAEHGPGSHSIRPPDISTPSLLHTALYRSARQAETKVQGPPSFPPGLTVRIPDRLHFQVLSCLCCSENDSETKSTSPYLNIHICTCYTLPRLLTCLWAQSPSGL